MNAIPVRITADRSETATQGEIRVQFWDKRERTLRALKLGGLCWAAAMVSVVIPLLHFVLVPGFFIAGPIVAYWIAGRESVVLGGSGVCPSCNASLPIARSSYRFPISDICTQCQSSVKIRAVKS